MIVVPTRTRRRLAVLPLALVAAVLGSFPGTSASALPGLTERVSVNSEEVEATGPPPLRTAAGAVSADGNVVVFTSSATNLVPGDTNGQADVFVRDRFSGATERVSVDSTGAQASGGFFGSISPGVSADGNLVVFASSATNLVPADTNGQLDVFVHDRTSGAIERVSVDSTGAQATGGPLGSLDPSISADGNVVAFTSTATNLVPGDTNGQFDVFVHDRTSGTTERVSVDSTGAQAAGNSGTPSISADGNVVAFASDAPNLVSSDTNAQFDVFVHDRTTDATIRVSVDSTGNQADGPSLAPDINDAGNVVVFWSDATNLVAADTNGLGDIFVHDRTTGMTNRTSVSSAGVEANAQSFQSPSISADGNRVAFGSEATNLVVGDTNMTGDVFVRDRAAATTTRESVDSSGGQGNGFSGDGNIRISGDGTAVAFASSATNLVSGDTNGVNDVFVHELQAGPPPPTSTTIEPPTTTTSTTMAPTTTTSTTMAPTTTTSTTMAPTTTTSTTMAPTTTTSTTMAPTTTTSTTMAPTTTTSTTMAPTTTTSTTMAPTTTTSTTMAPTTTTSTTMAPTTTTSTTMAPTTTTMAPPDGPLEIDDSALGSGNVVRITGTITCDEGQRFRLEVLIAQGDTNGRGVATGTCTGDPQNFRVNVTATSGPGFEDGSADVDATAQIGTPGSRTIVDTFSTSEDVTIDVRGGFMGQMLRAFQAMENLGA